MCLACSAEIANSIYRGTSDQAANLPLPGANQEGRRRLSFAEARAHGGGTKLTTITKITKRSQS